MCKVSTLLYGFTFYAYGQMRGQNPMGIPSSDRRSGALSSLGAGCVECEMVNRGSKGAMWLASLERRF